MIRRPSDAPKRSKDKPRDFDHAHNNVDYKDYDDDDEEEYYKEDYKGPDTNDVQNMRGKGPQISRRYIMEGCEVAECCRGHINMTSTSALRGKGQKSDQKKGVSMDLVLTWEINAKNFANIISGWPLRRTRRRE